MEVYVQPFPGPGAKWKVLCAMADSTPAGGRTGEMFFVAGDRALMAADIVGGKTFAAGDPSHSSPFVRARGRSITRTTSLRTANGSS